MRLRSCLLDTYVHVCVRACGHVACRPSEVNYLDNCPYHEQQKQQARHNTTQLWKSFILFSSFFQKKKSTSLTSPPLPFPLVLQKPKHQNKSRKKRNLQLRPPPTPQRSPILIRRLRIRRLSLQTHRITQLTRISLCQLLQRFLSLLSTLLCIIITIQIPLRGRRSCRDVIGKSLAACSCEVLVFEGGAVVATVQVSFGGGGSESGFVG